MQLKSYIQGRWFAGEGEAQQLRDATTGQVIASASSTGIDFRATLRYAREVGGPALRKLTFHERAALLKQLAKKLTEFKEEFYTLSYATGATKMDSMIDIDGGFGTLFAYASRGSRELPNSRVYIDGDIEMLSKTGIVRRSAHLRAARRRGCAHQCLQLSGVGHVGKARAHIARGRAGHRQAGDRDCVSHRAGGPAHRRVRHSAGGNVAVGVRQRGRFVRSSDLPGRGVVHGLGEHGAEAAHSSRPSLRNSVRFMSETDSINSCVLAEDAKPGQPEFDLFVREVTREMTAKAGQKCTAIRKAIVPAAHADAVVQALKASLAKIVVGDPRLEDVRMGPLAALSQRREVHRPHRRTASRS